MSNKDVKIFTLDNKGNLLLGARIGLGQGKWARYPSIGSVSPIRVDILKPGDIIWFAHFMEFQFPGEQNWEHEKLLIPLPENMVAVEKIGTERCILVTPKETQIIKLGEVKFLSDQTAVFFQEPGIRPSLH